MKRRLKYVLLLFCWITIARFQSNAQTMTHLSFRTLSGGVVLVQAGVSGIGDSLQFILDTGSSGVSLDSTLLSEKIISTEKTADSLRGIGGSIQTELIRNRKLTIGTTVLDSLHFRVYDYAPLHSFYGERIDGILGYDFFSRLVVSIDYDHNHMTLSLPHRVQYPSAGHLFHIPARPIPVSAEQFTEKKTIQYPFYWDTGAGLALLLNESLVNDSTVFSSGKKIQFTQAAGVGGKKQMRITVMKSIKIGPYVFRKVPVYLFKDEDNITNYPTCGGLIGNDIFRRFNSIINYPQHEIYLKPNSHFRELFDYGYTGFSIYLQDEKIIVDDIIENSPGQKAGLKEGDELIAVDHDFSGNLQHYKDLFQEPDKKMKVFVKRSGQLLDLELRTGSIE
jgi:hypothetical protein